MRRLKRLKKHEEPLISLPITGVSRDYLGMEREDEADGRAGGIHNAPRPTRRMLTAGIERIAVLLSRVEDCEAEILNIRAELGLGKDE